VRFFCFCGHLPHDQTNTQNDFGLFTLPWPRNQRYLSHETVLWYQLSVTMKVPSFSNRVCVGSPNNLVPRDSKLSAIDVIAIAICQGFVSVSGLLSVAKFNSLHALHASAISRLLPSKAICQLVPPKETSHFHGHWWHKFRQLVPPKETSHSHGHWWHKFRKEAREPPENGEIAF